MALDFEGFDFDRLRQWAAKNPNPFGTHFEFQQLVRVLEGLMYD
jgi:hypothetical protein